MRRAVWNRSWVATVCWAVAVLFAGSATRADAAGDGSADWPGKTAAFLQTLARDDGGYAFPDQAVSHLTPTFAAIGAQRLLGVKPNDPAKVALYVRGNHPQRWKKPERALHEFDLQQIQALLWLGENPHEQFDEMVSGWTQPVPYMTRYETHGYPAFQQEVACLLSRKLLGLSTGDVPNYLKYIQTRCRDNGSYNNTVPADDGSDGHVLNTLWALRGLAALDQQPAKKEELIRWLQSCQRPDGHFAYAPQPPLGGQSNDVIYTWGAVQALQMLGAKPSDSTAVVKFVHSLYHENGGFGDRPGWPANSVATYYAVATLAALDAMKQPIDAPAADPAPPSLPDGLKVFSIMIEAPGVGSPADAVELARTLKIDLWGAKNPKSPDWLPRAQQIADGRKVPVKFFFANEEYGTFTVIPGMGTYSHLVDVVAPPGVDFGKSQANAKPVPAYTQFVQTRIAELEKAGGRNVYQFNENECLARMLLDQAIESGTGFSAISTFHFGNPDFVNSSPYLWIFQHKLPMVGLHDNHASEPWYWAEQLNGFRTLFVAKEPTWDQWLDALKHNRVMAVRHDDVSEGRTWMHGGDPATRQRVWDERSNWQWWRDKPSDPQPPTGRPMLSLVVLTPADKLEVGHPEQDVVLRVRRRWENGAQGNPKRPTAELEWVELDGKRVEAVRGGEPATPAKGKAPAKAGEEFFLVKLPTLPPGRHTAKARVKPIADVPASAELEQVVEFEVK